MAYAHLKMNSLKKFKPDEIDPEIKKALEQIV